MRERWTQLQGSVWIKKLITNLDMRLDRAYGEVEYYTTQMLTGHGCFEEYLFRFGRRRSSICMYCPAVDTAEHTLFYRPYWTERRRAADIRGLNSNGFLGFLLTSSDNWRKFEDFARLVLREKDEEASPNSDFNY
ncbi:uncharacterized protein LOC142331956 [Lycorma delicatula]|uniref:uncharacterized protein LOC142331956 n=1 Tax=Lycorma delicatula TaxID=130591 RepID=UPI003F517039